MSDYQVRFYKAGKRFAWRITRSADVDRVVAAGQGRWWWSAFAGMVRAMWKLPPVGILAEVNGPGFTAIRGYGGITPAEAAQALRTAADLLDNGGLSID